MGLATTGGITNDTNTNININIITNYTNDTNDDARTLREDTLTHRT